MFQLSLALVLSSTNGLLPLMDNKCNKLCFNFVLSNDLSATSKLVLPFTMLF